MILEFLPHRACDSILGAREFVQSLATMVTVVVVAVEAKGALGRVTPMPPRLAFSKFMTPTYMLTQPHAYQTYQVPASPYYLPAPGLGPAALVKALDAPLQSAGPNSRACYNWGQFDHYASQCANLKKITH